MNNQPNLFKYATSELSQDAVICWLLEWSDPAHSDDEGLHKCGVEFVRAMLNKHEKCLNSLTIEKIEIHRQDQQIDVLARISDSDGRRYVLLIEDKTGTKDHGGQLKRYLDTVIEGKTKLGPVEKENLCPIYLKTGNQSLRHDQRIMGSNNEPGYKLFHRKDFLEVLEFYKGDNAILTDFKRHLQEIEYHTKSHKKWTREEWEQKDHMGEYWYWNAWAGLFRFLEKELLKNYKWRNWGYVPRPGNFLGCWWGPEDSELYLLIECRRKKGSGWRRAKLCFKVSAKGQDKSNQKDLKWKWHRKVMEAGGELVEKPARMKIGQNITVAVWKGDWLAFGEDGKLDKQNTVSNLKQVAAVLKRATNIGAEN